MRFKSEAKILEIGDVICRHPLMLSNFGLLSGASGIALFLFYLGRHSGNKAYSAKAKEYIEGIFNSLASSNTCDYFFSRGLSGFGWTYNHLLENKFIDGDHTQIDIIDEIISHEALKDINAFFYDYLHGAIGAGFYFLTKEKLTAKDKSFLHKMIYRLYRIKVSFPYGIAWEDHFGSVNDQAASGKIRYNFGLAHGIPSIIIFLCKCYEKGIDMPLVKEMIEGATAFLRNHKAPANHKSISIFPTYVEKGSKTKFNSRLGWCYGDLGIAKSFWTAGITLESSTLIREAKEIMIHASYRTTLTEQGVNDACICHGAAGLAQIFNRFYLDTKMYQMREATEYWIEQTIRMAQYGNNLAGYRIWQSQDDSSSINYGLLNGVAGIGLALISCTGLDSSKWDGCILLS